jgi:cytochrome c-type biogenesis protein
MLQNLLDNAGCLVQTNPWLAFGAVFIGGLLTACNPCVLAMIPLMIGFVGGMEGTSGFKKSFLFTLVFILGLSITFAILGIIAATAGKLLGDVGVFWKWIAGGVCVIMGIHLLDLIKFNVPAFGKIKVKQKGLLGAFLLGLLFGIVSTPCAAPILVVLLTYIAASGSSIVYGAILLLVYALGHCMLILVVGTSVGLAKGLLESKGFRTSTNILRKSAGVLIMLVGIYFLFFLHK